ncbi:MAG: hypothetical protein HFI75_14480 [Lachnospiraceae bacterium]|nr:hypothetical protein [Lachnospiraceae bacterium]
MSEFYFYIMYRIADFMDFREVCYVPVRISVLDEVKGRANTLQFKLHYKIADCQCMIEASILCENRCKSIFENLFY